MDDKKDKKEIISDDELKELDDSFIFGFDALDFDLDPYMTFLRVFLIRFGLSMTFGEHSYHPDQNWQGIEAAYQIVYHDSAKNIATWEWQEMYTLRSVLYPLYLSIPVQILKTLGLDYNCLVMNSMFFMNALVIALGDYYLYLLSYKFAGRQAAKISLCYMIFNYRMNYIFLKTLTNGVEAVFCMMGFYYYTGIKDRFDKNMALMTFAITISFLVRSSSLIGWIPLVLI
jgi:hypothetical protein